LNEVQFFYGALNFFGLFEILERTSSRSLGLFAHRASAPAARASTNIAIIIRRLMKNPDKRGGKRMLPACCLPLWGERGSPSWLPQRISELPEKEDFNKAFFGSFLLIQTQHQVM
jgi:hypothetical protein